MASYARPVAVVPTFHDSKGAVIRYGQRWGIDGPPEETYSVDSHPERFLPLHDVADALVRYLAEEFECEVSENVDHASDLVQEREDGVRAVRVVPRTEDAATLTFVFTAYPGIVVHAGCLHDATFPMCGCDACDETWEPWAERLEQLIEAVILGGFSESLPRPTWVGYSLTYSDGSESGEGDASHVPQARLNEAARRLESLPSGWAPWPRRGTLVP